jgi:hypothetical protein
VAVRMAQALGISQHPTQGLGAVLTLQGLGACLVSQRVRTARRSHRATSHAVRRPATRTTRRHTIHVALKPRNPPLSSPLIAERKIWSCPPRPYPFSSPPAPVPRPSGSRDLVSAR